MTLLDLRRYAVRQRTSIHFRAPEAGDCVINEHGLLKMPSLDKPPEFSFDSTLAGIEEFELAGERVSRSRLESLVGGAAQPGETAAEE